MSPEIYRVCAEYLERLGAAEYKQHCEAFRKLKKKPVFSPSDYMRKLVELLGKRAWQLRNLVWRHDQRLERKTLTEQ